MSRRERGTAANIKQLGGDLLNIGWKSASVSMLLNGLNNVPGEIEITKELCSSYTMGGFNYLFRRIQNSMRADIDRRPDVVNIAESFMVGLNPIAVTEILNSFLSPGMKAIALTGLAVANASVMFAAERLGETKAGGDSG